MFAVRYPFLPELPHSDYDRQIVPGLGSFWKGVFSRRDGVPQHTYRTRAVEVDSV